MALTIYSFDSLEGLARMFDERGASAKRASVCAKTQRESNLLFRESNTWEQAARFVRQTRIGKDESDAYRAVAQELAAIEIWDSIRHKHRSIFIDPGAPDWTVKIDSGAYKQLEQPFGWWV